MLDICFSDVNVCCVSVLINKWKIDVQKAIGGSGRSSDERRSSMKISILFSFNIIAGVLVFASVVRTQTTRGIPGVDYPNFHSIPKTSFSCSGQKYIPGFYADLETKCQAFHFCFKDRQESFLCPTGTIFNQAKLACDSWYTSNCSLAPLFYSVNAGPAMEGAGRNLPMLIKLRNRSQGKSMPSSTPNVFEKISSLYEASTDITTSYEGPETSSFAGNLNEVPSSNVSNDTLSEESPGESEITENKEKIPEEGLSRFEDNLKGDSSVEKDETYAGDSENTSELDEEMEADSIYDPVTGGYYMNFDPYQTEWRQDSEPANDEFKRFYDPQNIEDEYEANYEDNDDSGEDETSEILPEGLDLNYVGQDITDETEFLKRQLGVEKSTKLYRKRPMYVVVEDEEDIKPSESRGDGYLGDEPELASSTERATSDSEDSTKIAEGSSTEAAVLVDETPQHAEPPEVSEEVLKRLQFPYRPVYSTPRPLTADEFGHLILTELVESNVDELPDELRDEAQEEVTLIPSEQEDIYGEGSSDVVTDFQGDQSVNIQDVTDDEAYELDSPAYEFGTERENSGSATETSADSDVNPWKKVQVAESAGEAEDAFVIIPDESDDVPYSVDDNYVDKAEGTEPEDSAADDTFVVIPDESDEVSDSGLVDNKADKTIDVESENEYTYEVGPNEQPVVDNLNDAGYDAYEDAYEYYRSLRQLPEGYETVESTFEGPEFDYGGHYGGQYMPEQMYEGAGGYEDNIDYSNYKPEEARLAYLSALRSGEPYSYMRQRYPPMGYMDPIYGAEGGYFREDLSRNPYIDDGEASEYYESDETKEHYSEPETPWVQENSSEGDKIENELGITDSPLPVDITEADLLSSDETSSASVGSEEQEDDENFKDLTPDDERREKKEETYYVFDFDEDNEKEIDGSNELITDAAVVESDVDKSPYMADFSEQLDAKEVLEPENLQSIDESISNDNSSFYKDPEMSRESSKPEGNEALDAFFTSQNGNTKSSDLTGEGEAAFSIKPVTDTWSSFATESSGIDKPVTLSSALERLSALNTVKSPQASSFGNRDFSSDPQFLNSMAFPESMDFGPYGYGASMGQQYSMLDSMQPSQTFDGFSHRTGEEQGKFPKLSSLQDRLRSMKQGKFGVFKKYMSSMKNRKD